ncbi:MAG: response regulator [Deltaproteobacteria bacterium]|nr:response regulator [Deltaproteobacteria bacterium]
MSANKKKILVVDDELLIRTLLSEMLAEADYIVDAAENGEKALQLLDNNIYDLIISDVNMPEMDGISLFRKATENLTELNKRFLFITGNPTNETLSFFKVNNLEYITKPFQITDVLGRISSMTKEDINLSGRKGMYWRKEERFSYSTYCGINIERLSNSSPLIAKTENISKNGMKVRYIGEPLIPGSKISIYMMNLNLQRDAKVMWSKAMDEMVSVTGLNFTEQIQLKGLVPGI